MLLHDGLVHELVREHVFPRRIVDDDRCVADYGSEVVKRDGVDALPTTDANSAELSLPVAANDAVDVLSAVGGDTRTGGVTRRHEQVGHD